MSERQDYSNGELGIMLKNIQDQISHINKYIEGNGKKGLLDRMNDAEKCLENNTVTIKSLVKTRQSFYTKFFDIGWKVVTTAIMVILGVDKWR